MSGAFGSRLRLGDGLRVAFGNAVTVQSGAEVDFEGGTLEGPSLLNDGLLGGDGRIEADGGLTNSVSGKIRSGARERLHVAVGTVQNFGEVQVIGSANDRAEAEFDEAFSNEASGEVVAENAVLRFHDGLENDGTFAVSDRTSVFGDVVSTGSIIISGGGEVRFYDDVVQNGDLRVSASGTRVSAAVFYGTFSGSGGATGGGDIFFEGDFRPGNSPASVEFDNSLIFGELSTLEFELGGLRAGSDYDQIVNGRDTTLDGRIEIVLTGGFQPGYGDTFDLFVADSLTDAGAEFVLPELQGGLLFEMEFVQSSGFDTLQLTVVPEPSVVGLAAVSLLVFLAMRRKVSAVS
jgi:hypothetical protein